MVILVNIIRETDLKKLSAREKRGNVESGLRVSYACRAMVVAKYEAD